MDKKTKKELEGLGIGVASAVIVGVLATTVRKMQKEGKLNKREGEKIIKNTMAQVNAASTKYAGEAQEQVDKVLKASVKASPFATKKEIRDLNAKMDKLMKMQKAGAKKSGRRR